MEFTSSVGGDCMGWESLRLEIAVDRGMGHLGGGWGKMDDLA